MQISTTTTKNPPLFSLIVLISLGSVAAVLFTPGLPAIKQQLTVSPDTVQWTVTIFMIGYALGQLIYGPVTNRIQRKPTLYLGISIGIIGSLLSATASPLNSFSILLIGRFLQAIGTSCGLTMTLTIINDIYATEKSRKIIAFTSSAFAILPGLAVYIGGILVSHINWEATFYFLAFYCVFAFILCILLPETSKQTNPYALKLKNIIKQYKAVGASTQLWCYSLMWGLCTSIVYVFAATAPIIAISIIGLSPSIYGAFNLFPSTGLLSGTVLAGIISHHLKARTVILIGITLTTISCFILLIFAWSGFNEWKLFIPMFFIYSGIPFILSNASALATKNTSDKATASSLLSFINMSTSVIALLVIGTVHEHPEYIMSEVFTAIGLFLIFLFFITRRFKAC